MWRSLDIICFIFLQKFEAYDSNGTVVAGDKNKEVGSQRTVHLQEHSQCENTLCGHLLRNATSLIFLSQYHEFN